MTIPDVIKLLASIPPAALEDAIPIVEEGTKLAADVQAYLAKYPQIIEAIKKLNG